jgi:hypothetical protein
MVEKFPPPYELTTRPCTTNAGRHRWVITSNGKPIQTSENSFETSESAQHQPKLDKCLGSALESQI